MFFYTSDNTIQQNEFLIKGKIKAAAMLFDVIAFQTREREANSFCKVLRGWGWKNWSFVQIH